MTLYIVLYAVMQASYETVFEIVIWEGRIVPPHEIQMLFKFENVIIEAA
mgnify:CR=1 FL=1